MNFLMINDMSWVLILFISTFFLFVLTKRGNSSIPKRLPPGPIPLPLLGNLLKLLPHYTKPHKHLAELASHYGPIMTLKLGSLTSIVISSSSVAKDFLQKHDLLIPFVPDAVRAYQHDQHSAAWLPTSATKCRTFRKIYKSHLFNNQRLDSMQGIRLQEVSKLLDFVKECAISGIAIDFAQAFSQMSFNFMFGSIFSMDSSHSSLKEIMGLVRCMANELGTPNFVDYYPVFKKLDPQGIRYRLSILCMKLFKVFDEIIAARLEARKENNSLATSCKNDLLDILLDIIEEENSSFTRQDVKHLILDLIGAGTDTTSVTLEWAMAELIRNPSTLQRAQEEIDMNIDKGKAIEESDISKLPYLRAIVKEIFRLYPAAPLLLPFKASQDIEVSGFTIPKGSQVLVNAWAIGRHPSTWPDPNSFVPERFLGSEIDVKGQHFGLIPFGTGSRTCPGLPLAYSTVHVVLASLIRSFNWEIHEVMPGQTLDMDEKCGITLRKAEPLHAIPIPLV